MRSECPRLHKEWHAALVENLLEIEVDRQNILETIAEAHQYVALV